MFSSRPCRAHEQLPLVVPADATVEPSARRVLVRRANGSVFRVEVSTPGATITLGEPARLTDELFRRLLTLSASDTLHYELSFP